MKITFVCASLNLAGGTRIIANYALQLHQRGHQVTIVSKGKIIVPWERIVKNFLRGRPIPKPTLPDLTYFQDSPVPIKFVEGDRPIREEDVPDADVIIATFWITAEWIANFSQKKGAKVYFVQHHEVFDYFTAVDRERARKTYYLPLHKIVIAQWLEKLMESDYGDSRVSLVPNSVDTALFKSEPRDKQKTPTVGFMYSTVPWKGAALILEAISLAQQIIPSLQLFAFGSQQAMSELPLPQQCDYFYSPPQSKLKDIYSHCDVWLFGSSIEGFGLPLLEAMACRTPVIATKAGAAPELVSQGSGILLNSRDPQEMSQAIIDLVQYSNEDWCKMSENAYRVATSYSWDDATTLFEAALQEAIDR
jgi:glycosyltransferase involved in cell wall biosynthesis